MAQPARSVAEIHELLAGFAARETPLAGDVPAVLVSHGVQCAEVIAERFPNDPELVIAGLLHDIGLLLVPGDELGHPRHGADYVRWLFGDRCAELIALHVDAQRYLELTVPGYVVVPPPTSSFAEQPTPMSDEQRLRFVAHPLFDAAVALREADDLAKDEQRRITDLGPWVRRMSELAQAR